MRPRPDAPGSQLNIADRYIEHGSLMAGQSVCMVKSKEPVADIIETLMVEAGDAIEVHKAGGTGAA